MNHHQHTLFICSIAAAGQGIVLLLLIVSGFDIKIIIVAIHTKSIMHSSIDYWYYIHCRYNHSYIHYQNLMLSILLPTRENPYSYNDKLIYACTLNINEICQEKWWILVTWFLNTRKLMSVVTRWHSLNVCFSLSGR